MKQTVVVHCVDVAVLRGAANQHIETTEIAVFYRHVKARLASSVCGVRRRASL